MGMPVNLIHCAFPDDDWIFRSSEPHQEPTGRQRRL